MKVAILGTTACSLLNFRKHLIKELVRNHHQVLAFAQDYDHSSREAVIRLGATPVNSPLKRSGLNPFKQLWAVYKLYRLLRRHQPKVILSYFQKPLVLGTLAATLARIPRRVGMLEGLGYYFTQSPQQPSFKKRLIKRCLITSYRFVFPTLNRLILLNPDDYQELFGDYQLPQPKAVSQLPGIGVCLKAFPFSQPPSYPLTFLLVGRLLNEKGILEYLEAAEQLKNQYPNVHFQLLGARDAANPGSLSQEAWEHLKTTSAIDYLGATNNVQPYLKACSVFVLPSYREGCSLSIQEALATGRPIITTQAPGCRHLVDPHVNGLLITPGSSEELAQACKFFIDNPDYLVTMGQASHHKARQDFDTQIISKTLLKWLET